MPLTTVDAHGAVVDSTNCSDEVWATVHKVRRADLRCRDCGGRLNAKVSPLGLRFFAHHNRPEVCRYQGEGPEHRTLKSRVADVIRACGFQAVIEASPAPGDRGGWRADVLGIAPDGRRVAFEVQLAPMTLEVGKERTAKYTADRVRTVWLSSKHPAWMCWLPSAHLVVTPDSVHADRGLARANLDTLRWEPPEDPVDFAKVARGLLDGRIVTAYQNRLVEQIEGRDRLTGHAVVLVPRDDVRRLWEAEQARAEEERRAARDQARWSARAARHRQAAAEAAAAARSPLSPEAARTRHLALTAAVRDAQQADPTAQILLGVPPRPSARQSHLVWSVPGSDAVAGATLVWTRHGKNPPTLWAVVCPDVNLLRPQTAESWTRQRVRFYVGTPTEAQTLTPLLGSWPTPTVITCDPAADSDLERTAGATRRGGRSTTPGKRPAPPGCR